MRWCWGLIFAGLWWNKSCSQRTIRDELILATMAPCNTQDNFQLSFLTHIPPPFQLHIHTLFPFLLYIHILERKKKRGLTARSLNTACPTMILPSTSVLTFVVTSLRSGAIRQPLLVPFLLNSPESLYPWRT